MNDSVIIWESPPPLPRAEGRLVREDIFDTVLSRARRALIRNLVFLIRVGLMHQETGHMEDSRVIR